MLTAFLCGCKGSGLEQPLLHSPLGCCLQVGLLQVAGDVQEYLQGTAVETTQLWLRTAGTNVPCGLVLFFIHAVSDLAYIISFLISYMKYVSFMFSFLI